MPWAPGTWGSAAGLLVGWFAGGRLPHPAWLLLVLAATFMASAVICTQAERELAQHDPGSVVLDEAWAMAAIIMILPWMRASGLLLFAAFLLFRGLDMIKPWPLQQLARLPGGWGIMADDLGAAAYAILILLACAKLTS